MVDERRIAALERQTEALSLRVALLETELHGVPEPPNAPAALQEPADTDRAVLAYAAPGGTGQDNPPETEPTPAAPEWFLPWPLPRHGLRRSEGAPSLEDVLGGRVLAWLGGILVLVGLAFFFALAVSRGWIGEGARTALAGIGSTGLLLLGVWLHERRGRTDAAVASVATGVAGLFMTLTVGAVVYGVIPVAVGLALALAAGAVATALAVRWQSRPIAALGIVGALLSPVLVGAPAAASTAAFLFVAGLSAAAVLVWQRWDWLAFVAFVVSTPQWLGWVLDGVDATTALVTLVAFGALNVAAAVGYEIRLPAARLRLSSSFLLSLNALVLGAGGYYALVDAGGQVAELWLAFLAVAHIAIGLLAASVRRVSHEIRLLVLVLGVVLADVALASLVDGPALAACWALTAVGFAGLLRGVARGRPDDALVMLGLGSHIALAVVHAFVNDAPPDVVETAGLDVAAAVIAVGSIAAACIGSARLAGERRELRMALDALGLLAVGYLTAVTLDGLALVGAWSLEAVALGKITRRTDDEVAAAGACGFVLAALCHVLALDASPVLLPGNSTDVVPALAVGAVTVAAFACAYLRVGGDTGAALLAALGGALVLYATALVLGGPLLAGAWALEAAAIAGFARGGDDRISAAAAAAFLGAAVVHALAFEAPLDALLYGVESVPGAVIALAAIAVAGIAAARLDMPPAARGAGWGVAGVALLYLASVAIVTAFQPAATDFQQTVLDLDVRQQGQALLSALWGLAGVTALVVGLTRDLRGLRLAALALLLVTVGKVFLYDLAALEAGYRVASFVALGLLLLAGAFAWQRMRPRPLADLREVPAGIR